MNDSTQKMVESLPAINTALSEFDRVAAGLAELRKAYDDVLAEIRSIDWKQVTL